MPPILLELRVLSLSVSLHYSPFDWIQSNPYPFILGVATHSDSQLVLSMHCSASRRRFKCSWEDCGKVTEFFLRVRRTFAAPILTMSSLSIAKPISAGITEYTPTSDRTAVGWNAAIRVSSNEAPSRFTHEHIREKSLMFATMRGARKLFLTYGPLHYLTRSPDTNSLPVF